MPLPPVEMSLYEAWDHVETLREAGYVLHLGPTSLSFRGKTRASARHGDGKARSIAAAVHRARRKLPYETPSRRPRVALVSCAKTKRPAPARARDLYAGPYFAAMRDYAERECDEWWILSALFGVVHPDEELAPYDLALPDLSRPDQRAWGHRVAAQLHALLPPRARVELHAGDAYVRDLAPLLRATGRPVSLPLQGARIGHRLRWYTQQRGASSSTRKR